LIYIALVIMVLKVTVGRCGGS